MIALHRLHRAAVLALLPLALAACEEGPFAGLDFPGRSHEEAALPEVPVDPHPPAVSPLQVPVEIEGARTVLATANAATLGVASFTARGNDPAWQVAIGNGRAVLTRAGQADARTAVQAVNFASGVEYVGTLGGRPFTVNIRVAPCRDSVSGAKWPMTARVGVAGNQFAGCAAPTEQAPAAKAAPTAKAAPAAKTTPTSKATPAANGATATADAQAS